MDSYGFSFRPMWMKTHEPYGRIHHNFGFIFCSRCGKSHPKNCCAALCSVCWRCGKYGHFARKCFSRSCVETNNDIQKKKRATVSTSTQTEPDTERKNKSQKKQQRDRERKAIFNHKRVCLLQLPFSKLNNEQFSIEVVLQNKLENANGEIENLKKELLKRSHQLREYENIVKDRDNEIKKKNKMVTDLTAKIQELQDKNKNVTLVTKNDKTQEIRTWYTTDGQPVPVRQDSSGQIVTLDRYKGPRTIIDPLTGEKKHQAICSGRGSYKRGRGGHSNIRGCNGHF